MVSDKSWLGLIFTIVFYHAHTVRLALIRTAVFHFLLCTAFWCFILHQLEIVQNITLMLDFRVLLPTPVSLNASSGSSYLFVIAIFSIICNITAPMF